MKLLRELRNNPFIRIIVPVVTGVVLSRSLALPTVVLSISAAICYTMAWVVRRRKENIYIVATLVLTAAAMANLTKTSYEIPCDTPVVVCLQIVDTPHTAGRWQKTTAEVGFYRMANDSQWHRVRQRIVLNVDTAFRVKLGEQYAARGYMNRFDRYFSTTDDGKWDQRSTRDYASLMDARGYSGSLYLLPYNVITKSPTSYKTIGYYAKQLQQRAVRHIERLNLHPSHRSVVITMAAGERRSMDKRLLADYARVGASHLLAVSGLHLAMIFVLLNGVFYLLPLMRNGHIIKSIAVISAVWLYAALTGFSPSVIRSAMMFSGAQIAFATTQHRNSLNILLGTAVVMLLVDPNNLYDISFQLSYLAVFFILLCYRPLYRLLTSQSKILNILTAVTLMGFIATLGTMPWVSYKFGNIPLIGMATNIVLIYASNLIIALAVGWIIAPIPLLNSLISWAIGIAIELQNKVVVWSAGLKYGAISYRMEWWMVALSYTILLALAVWLWSRDGGRKFELQYKKQDGTL